VNLQNARWNNKDNLTKLWTELQEQTHLLQLLAFCGQWDGLLLRLVTAMAFHISPSKFQDTVNKDAGFVRQPDAEPFSAHLPKMTPT
jgi:hypothetical protein